uniref:Calmodulin-binding transcription activator 1 n=1 Tax=Cacopsylla melanoneura TaxID=428564 RepID=A0A8D8YD88_9HEMI
MNISEDNNNVVPASKKKVSSGAEVVVPDTISSKTKILIPISNFNLINLFSSSKDAPLKFNYIINNANISHNDLLCLNTNEEEPSGSQGTRTEELTPPPVVTASGKISKKSAHQHQQEKAADSASAGGNKLIVDGEAIKLPENLESLPKAEHFPTQRHRWNTNEEIAAILISFEKHAEWQSKEVRIRPKSGSMLLYSRKKVRYRRDGYCWKKRKDGKTTREDHMKLKVQGTECIYGCYVHSAILPTFHRRCYWLLQNPDIVLVHYLNVPYPADDNKMAAMAPSLALWADKKEWSKEELISQLRPMFYSEDDPNLNNELEISTAETVEAIVGQLMEKQRHIRAAAALECGCPDSTCSDGKSCTQPIRRITPAKQSGGKANSNQSDSNHVSSTTGSSLLLPSSRQQHVFQQPSSVQTSSASSPLVVSLSQLQGSNGSVLILNSGTSQSRSTKGSSNRINHTYQRSGHGMSRQALDRRSQSSHNINVKHEVMETDGSCQLSNGAGATGSATSKGGVSHSRQSSHSNSFDLRKADRSYSAAAAPGETKLHHVNNDHSVSNKNKKADSFNPVGSVAGSGGSSSNYSSAGSMSLDLTQEDIQKYIPSGGKDEGLINPMEFIDVAISPLSSDDVFVNLDAFDMLSDFPDFDCLESTVVAAATSHAGVSVHGSAGDFTHTSGSTQTSSHSSGPGSTHRSSKNPPPERMDMSPRHDSLVNITDYSPEWSYTEGGIKVLVTGPWYSSTAMYLVLFDSEPVATNMVQSGVLRCYCPAHEEGIVNIQVTCDGYVISNSVVFEYKRQLPTGPEPATDAQTVDKTHPGDELLKFSLAQRLEAVDDKLKIKEEVQDPDYGKHIGLFRQNNFEDKVVVYCQSLSQRSWKTDEAPVLDQSWCSSHRQMTLLHLSAYLGYSRLVCALLHWKAENSSSILEVEVDALRQDKDGFTPLMWACHKGHRDTALLLYQWNHTALSIVNSSSQSPVECARVKGFVEIADEIDRLENIRKANDSATSMFKMSERNNDEFGNIADEFHGVAHEFSNVTELTDEFDQSRDEDDLFLHPSNVAAVRNLPESPKYKILSVELHLKIPTSCGAANSLSNDSVVNSPSSPASSSTQAKLVKRASVDSGIHVLDTSSHAAASRFDRSMSLPVSSPQSDNTRLSPLSRRMDFTLCDVVPSISPPLPATLDDSDLTPEDSVGGNTAGDQDARVLTLAEQIIAAIPDRIKNESEDDPMECLSIESPLLLDDPPPSSASSCFDNSEFNFELADQNYRYYDVATPSSSLSPASSSCLPSPCPSFPNMASPPPTTADFCEFFHASLSSSGFFEKEFSNLTLSDREQRELYEAAKIIQKAYRWYKGRKKLEEQEKERAAAILIQNYYRRYKQYAYYKQRTKAALVIQNGYRSYCEHKRYKKNQEAALRIQNCYRNYRDQGCKAPASDPCTSLKRTFSQRRQHQAARKIQQFMRQSKNNNIWTMEQGLVTERTCHGGPGRRKREAAGVPLMTGCPPKQLAQYALHNRSSK